MLTFFQPDKKSDSGIARMKNRGKTAFTGDGRGRRMARKRRNGKAGLAQ
jgi:hypothetical protein